MKKIFLVFLLWSLLPPGFSGRDLFHTVLEEYPLTKDSHSLPFLQLPGQPGFLWFGTDDGLNKYDDTIPEVYKLGSTGDEDTFQ